MPARATGAGSFAFSPDGRQIAATIGLRGQPESRMSITMELVVWDTASGKVREFGHASNCVTFSPDGARIAASMRSDLLLGPGMAEIGLWDAVTGRQVLVLKGHASYVYAIPRSQGIAFSRDGNQILSAVERLRNRVSNVEESEVKVWDATPWTGKP
jgi:WD40 repeat protein